MTPSNKEKIGSIDLIEQQSVYRRSNGETWMKLSSTFHIRVTLQLTMDGRGRWVGTGVVEEIDQEEEVERIDLLSCSADE